MVITMVNMARTATPMVQDMLLLVPRTLNKPPRAIIGANMTTLRIITKDCWICWMSFVLLVTREAVENLSISSWLKETTFLNTSPRNRLPNRAATREAK